MATAPSPNDLTRQQLDELDALLQRMLSVPLAPPDTPLPGGLGRADAPPLPPAWRPDPPAPASAPAASLPQLALMEPPSSAKIEPEPKPVAKAEPKPPTPEPKPVAKAPTPAPAKPQTAPTPAPTPAPAKPQVSAAPPVPLPLLPLVALNAAFDSACGLLGPLGRVLRSGFFKHIYGLAGLGLLAYTIAHVAQTQGWVTLPIVLPWPQSWPR